jgi:dienelactone hydrolase
MRFAMTLREKVIEIALDDRRIAGTLISPSVLFPGVLFVHGWAGSQEQYLVRGRELSSLGCLCLTFDLYGHAKTLSYQETVTREDNLRDVIAAYDHLASLPLVDNSAIAVIGSSYGGYLSAILTALRPVKYLALRAPALYKDADWAVPKGQLNRPDLMQYRLTVIKPADNRALEACSSFEGDVLLVESEYDDIVPAAVTANYRTAFGKAHSLTFRVLEGADHALSTREAQDAYTSLLTAWATQLIVSARKQEA